MPLLRANFPPSLLPFPLDMFLLEGERERESCERATSISCLWYMPQTAIWVCVLTGNQTHDP